MLHNFFSRKLKKKDKNSPKIQSTLREGKKSALKFFATRERFAFRESIAVKVKLTKPTNHKSSQFAIR